MKIKQILIATLSLTIFCSCSPAVNITSEPKSTDLGSDASTLLPPGLGSPNNPTQTPPGDDDIVGASSGFVTNISETLVPQWPNMSKSYLFNLTQSNAQIPLNYRTLSGDTVYAHVWFYIGNAWKPFGWQYNPQNTQMYSGSLTAPSQAQAVFIGFFSVKGGSVSAALTTSNSSSSKETLFAEASRRSPIGLGTAASGIVAASTSGVWKQEFSNGAILWREGQSQAFALPQPFWDAWKKSGQMTVYGLPIGDVQSGRTIQGISSRYQMYAGANSPSLHSSSLGTWRFYQQTRDVWNSSGNYDKLGHPIGDAEGGVQRFERGEIRNGQVIIQGATTVPSGSRSADFKNAWQYLGPFELAEIDQGKASHMSPAEIIYYSAKENQINPVLLLAKLQDEQTLLTGDKNFKTSAQTKPDFEWRLARACGYGATDGGDINTYKYYGFFPQLVSTSYQFEKYRTEGKNFQAAYQSFTTGAGKYDGFIRSLYPQYARAMNEVAGMRYSETPSSLGYFKDFRDISVSHVQRFLERYSGALKESDLFRQAPLASEKVSYR